MNRSLKKSIKYILIPIIILVSLISLMLILQFPEKSEANGKTAHVSFDDVYVVLKDITENENS